MRTIIVGLGVQGEKRRRFAGRDCVGSVDPAREADFTDLRQVPPDSFDAAMVCVPDAPKLDLLTWLAEHGKHVLVEKPLWAPATDDIRRLEAVARRHGAFIYTAYNHRFEPHFIRMRKLIGSGDLGQIYRCHMFYGNGTARLVRASAWRDRGAGVWPDLGSHLLDTLVFWFGPRAIDAMRLVSANRFENRAADHVVVASDSGPVKIRLEMSLLMWRNDFRCDLLAGNGTAHIGSLCKWGPATFTHRRRILPSGRPPEETVTLTRDDPTWAAEYAHFKSLAAGGYRTDLATDCQLNDVLQTIGAAVIAATGDPVPAPAAAGTMPA